MTVRVRLTLWYSALLVLLVVAFAAASYAYLRRLELNRIDSMLHEQSEIVTQAMVSLGHPNASVDSTGPACRACLERSTTCARAVFARGSSTKAGSSCSPPPKCVKGRAPAKSAKCLATRYRRRLLGEHRRGVTLCR